MELGHARHTSIFAQQLNVYAPYKPHILLNKGLIVFALKILFSPIPYIDCS